MDHPLLFDCTPALFSLQVVADTADCACRSMSAFLRKHLLTARQRNDV